MATNLAAAIETAGYGTRRARILRTAAQHNAVNVDVYASVVDGGTIRRGDAVVLA